MRTRWGRGRGEGMRNCLGSTPQHFRNRRSPTDGENIIPDMRIKCQKKSAYHFRKSVKRKQSGKSRQSVFKDFGNFLTVAWIFWCSLIRAERRKTTKKWRRYFFVPSQEIRQELHISAFSKRRNVFCIDW